MGFLFRFFVSLAFHYCIAIGSMALSYWLRFNLLYGMEYYLVVLYICYQVIPRYHVAGRRAFFQGDFEMALGHYEKSLDFFNRHSWLDKFGFILLLNTLGPSYSESARRKINYCRKEISLNTNDRFSGV